MGSAAQLLLTLVSIDNAVYIILFMFCISMLFSQLVFISFA